ncbi:MAG: LPS export ABC transporter periplasmic protein LptC [Candidatus Omnitrophica bacterium]|nr:LPS export ABC transporter periplasmic protein LptC [Candidatus Omnitrophota bacterium]MCM8799585.1 LPS export ABC transporter periplasmic protein LptC [Candidatus Omnitrophota bacterium]
MRIFILILFFCFILNSYAQEPEQNLSDFNLSGLNQDGKKSWEILGKSADIFSNIVKLKEVMAKLYRPDEEIELKAKEAEFDKLNGKLKLKKDVVITTTKGAKLITDSLDWDRTNQSISTKDKVNIESNSIFAYGLGILAKPDLKKINLEKNVFVQINSQKQNNPDDKITITCKGPLEIDYEKNIAVFHNEVKVVHSDIQIYSDELQVYFSKEKATAPSKESITKVYALGNVKIIRENNVSFSEEATYLPQDKKLLLSGKPKLIIYPEKEDLNANSRD